MKWTGISDYAIKPRMTLSRGFSLTEVAVVLAVVGLALGGIWALAAQSRENARQERLKTNIFIVVKNVRAYYASQNGIAGLSTAVTPQLASLNPPALPGDILRTGGGCALASCADHPWGASTVATSANGSFGICAWDVSVPGCTAGPPSVQFFAVDLVGVPLESCIKVAMANSGADAPSGLFDVAINGVSMVGLGRGLPVRLTDARAQCTNSSTMDFIFRLVTPQS